MASGKNVLAVFCALLFLVSHASGGFNFGKFSYGVETTKPPAAGLYRNDAGSLGESGIRKSALNEEEKNQKDDGNENVYMNDKSYDDKYFEKTSPAPNFYGASNKEDNRNQQNYWNAKVDNNDQSYEDEDSKASHTRPSPPPPSRWRSEAKQRQRYDDLADAKHFESSRNRHGQKYGMSDTRILENGKYFYNIKSEIGTENAWDKNINTKRYGADDFDGEP